MFKKKFQPEPERTLSRFWSFKNEIIKESSTKNREKSEAFCLFNHNLFIKISSIVAIMACLPPSNQPKQNESTNQTLWIQPLFNDLKVLFHLRGHPSLPRKPQDFWRVWGHFGPWNQRNSNPPFDGRRCRSCRSLAATLKDTKKLKESKCPVFSLLFGSRTIPRS